MEISACSLLLLQEPMQVAAHLLPVSTFTSQQGHPEPRWNAAASSNHLPWVLVKNLPEHRLQHPGRTLENTWAKGSCQVPCCETLHCSCYSTQAAQMEAWVCLYEHQWHRLRYRLTNSYTPKKWPHSEPPRTQLTSRAY